MGDITYLNGNEIVTCRYYGLLIFRNQNHYITLIDQEATKLQIHMCRNPYNMMDIAINNIYVDHSASKLIQHRKENKKNYA
jgi:hypothetical protein